jgi:hypothetical protein
MAAAPLSKSPDASPARATAKLHDSDPTPMATTRAGHPNVLSIMRFDLHICLNLLPVLGVVKGGVDKSEPVLPKEQRSQEVCFATLFLRLGRLKFPALTKRRYNLLFVMAEVGHVGCGFDIE